MSTVDYSGGTIISDWYTDGSQNNESIKITVRFLSNEIRSESLKVVVHKKNCSVDQTCRINLVENSILVATRMEFSTKFILHVWSTEQFFL